jgi:3-oxoacyl-(acyl-carrier-protein) synthase
MAARGATRVVLTGLGVVAPIGVGCDAFWQGIAQGRHAIGRFERARAPELAGCMVACLPSPWDLHVARPDSVDPCAQVAVAAAREAWHHAALGDADIRPEAVAVVLGTSAAGLASRSRYEFCAVAERALRHALLDRSQPARQTAHVARALGARGPRLTISTACASSTHALGHACDLLAAHHADAVLAGGSDVAVDELAAGFLALGAMSAEPCVPFSEAMGMSLGEGAGFAVLERLEDARARGAEILC